MLNYDIGMTEKQEIFTLLGGRIRVKRGFYNPTSDAVWLAAFVPNSVKNVLDVGIGTGGVSLCLANHNPKIKITGIDISSEMLADCAQNFELNGIDADLVNCDILKWRTDKTFDLVVSNPPYFKGTAAKHNAHHNVDLKDWTKKCIARVRPMGMFATIVNTASVPMVLSEMSKHCGNIRIFPLFSNKNTAERVLLSAKLGTRGDTVLYRGFNMNYEPVLRDGLTIADCLLNLDHNDKFYN